MKPDFELRKAIAVELFGRRPEGVYDTSDPPMYECDRNAAYLVVEEIERRGLLYQLCQTLLYISAFDAEFGPALSGVKVGIKCDPATICRAALAVIREHRKDEPA